MINAKKLYSELLSDSRITDLVPEENILNSYPNEVEIFPCIVFLDENQNDIEYNDNKVGGSLCSVMIHVFSKKLENYPTTSEIGIKIAEVMNEDLWNCLGNGEVSDPDPDTEHRVMVFNKSIYNN